jgi:phage shock protein PspC (stress-responsive transcriptional regulator)
MKDEPAQKDGRGRGDDDAGVAEDRQAVYPRLERRRTERMLGGVASGLADHFGLDPVLFRLGFMVLALFGGSGVLLYVLGWLFLPEEGADEPAVVAATRDIGVRKLAALALFAIALLFLGGPVWMPLVQADYLDASLLWSLVLVALGFLLLRGDPPPRSTAEPPPSPSTAAPGTGLAKRTTTATLPLRREAKPPRVSRRRSPLGWISMGAMLLVVGGAAVLDNLGVVELGLKDLLAAAVITLGSGLIAGAFWGRARWLIPVGIILMPGLILASVIELPLRGSIGGRSLQPRSAVELSQGYRVLAGDLWLHLENFDFNEGESITVPVDMVAGTLSIYVPRGVAVDIDGHIGAGGSEFPGRRDQGFELKLDESLGGSDLKRHLVLQVDAGVGFVSVYRNRLVKDLRAAAQAKGSEKKEENKKTQSTPKRSQNDKQGAG